MQNVNAKFKKGHLVPKHPDRLSQSRRGPGIEQNRTKENHVNFIDKETVNCWEYMKCGCAPGGKNTNSLGCCPAAVQEKYNEINNGVNGGRFCWLVEETLCDGEIQTAFLDKFENCLQCEFYLMIQRQQNEHTVEVHKENIKYLTQK